MKDHARKHPTIEAEDGRARAYWKFHAEGRSHKVPREGIRRDHFYVCSWCDPAQREWVETNRRYDADGGWTSNTGYWTYDDREVEKFILPQVAASNPMAWVGGRLG